MVYPHLKFEPMITKVYQLINKRRASFYTTYCGIGIKLDFMHNVTDDDRAQLIVTNKFLQDAIEKDSRFNKEFALANTYGEEVKSEVQSKPHKKNVQKCLVVEDVMSINDAYDYFADKGVILNSVDDVKAEMKKQNVEFPNLKL